MAMMDAIMQAAGRASSSALKNMSPALTDLGLGDNLKNQVEDEVNARKKKKPEAASDTNPRNYGDNVISPAVLSLFGQR